MVADRRNRHQQNRGAHRGQTLVVAIAALFILLFVGAVFVAEVAQNVVDSGAARNSTEALQFAEAGIRYCDDQLSSSIYGADWRPMPTQPVTSGTDPNGYTDPDYYWLSKGYARVLYNGGRSLVRVNYDPYAGDARSQFLEIDSVGRVGDLGTAGSTADPTIFIQKGPAPRDRNEKLAYKQIGITDYGLFVTDKNHRRPNNFIGTAPYGEGTYGQQANTGANYPPNTYAGTVLGDPTIGELQGQALANGTTWNGFSTLQQQSVPDLAVGFPMHVNGNLTIGGDVYIYENMYRTMDTVQVSGTVNIIDSLGQQCPPAGATCGLPGSNAATNGTTAYINQPPSVTNTGDPRSGVIDQPTTATNGIFTPGATGYATAGTVAGLFRTGSSTPDAQGYANNVPTIDPPRIDTPVNGDGPLRYRALSRDSGVWQTVVNGTTTTRYNTGQNGWGSAIYINNPGDLQPETANAGTTGPNSSPTPINGAYSLRADWLNPSSNVSQGFWDGPVYRPPGVLVELLGDRIRLTKDARDTHPFVKADGTPLNGTLNGTAATAGQGGQVLEIPLADLDRANYYYPDGTQAVFPNNGSPLAGQPVLSALSHDGDDPATRALINPNNTPPTSLGDANSYGVSLVIVAEGNVRVRGSYGVVTNPTTSTTASPALSRVHLTIVSAGTAYIEGNIVKGDGYINTSGVQVLEHASTCAILAKDYVCVNTTAFTAPLNSTFTFDPLTNATEIGTTRPNFDLAFSFGVNPVFSYLDSSGNQILPYLLLRHSASTVGSAAGTAVAYPMIGVNPVLTTYTPTGGAQIALSTFYQFSGLAAGTPPALLPYANAGALTGLPSSTYVVGNKPTLTGSAGSGGSANFQADDRSQAPLFETAGFPLMTTPVAGGYMLNMQPGVPNLLRFQLDNGAAQYAQAQGINAPPGGDYLLGQVAVAPLDIRIEAMLYAQEGSFFVIPGVPLNNDPTDRRDLFYRSQLATSNNFGVGMRPSYRVTLNSTVFPYTPGSSPNPYNDLSKTPPNDKHQKDLYPFYNEPTDVRITVFGAISENYTASQGDQAAWQSLWGWIPQYLGSSDGSPNTTRVQIPQIHLNVHDPGTAATNGYPYVPAEDVIQDFRTANEYSAGITRGLRIVYDPALSLPYYRPTRQTLDVSGGSYGSTFGTTGYRQQNALRCVTYPPIVGMTSPVVFTLPSVPRLPVCPGLLYFGDSETQTGP